MSAKVQKLCDRYAVIPRVMQRLLTANDDRSLRHKQLSTRIIMRGGIPFQRFTAQDYTARVNAVRVFAANALQDIAAAAGQWEIDQQPVLAAFHMALHTNIRTMEAWDLLEALRHPEVMGAVGLVKSAAGMNARAEYLESAASPAINQPMPKYARDVLIAVRDARVAPNRLQIATAIERDQKTLRETFTALEARGLIHKPFGERSGYAITEAGARWLQSAPITS